MSQQHDEPRPPAPELGFPVSVLKFGSSVLPSPAALSSVVEEIYRNRREGLGVVAVVSAFGDRTDELVAEADKLGLRDPRARAAFIGRGETESAAGLVAALEAAGQPARLLTPEEIELRADGPRDAAHPRSAGAHALVAALREGQIAVVPGFVAQHEDGGPALLGRGGSDLSALVLATSLGAQRCRLLKDTEGLFDRDPAAAGSKAQRFATVSFATAARLEGVVQRAAVNYAESRQSEFEVAAIASARTTRVGALPDVFDSIPAPKKPLRLAIAGLGSVGSALIRRLHCDERFEVVVVGVRDRKRPRPGLSLPPGTRLTEELGDLVESRPDVLVELIGGSEAAGGLMERALEAGVSVVTANKALLYERGPELQSLARRSGARLLNAAAVAGGIPLLEILASLDPEDVPCVEGSLNGTAAFVLEELERGRKTDEALQTARAEGYAEADATKDLSGQDSFEKIGLVARTLGAKVVAAARRGLDGEEEERLASAAVSAGAPTRRRLIARAVRACGTTEFTLDVAPASIPADDFLAGGIGPENRLRIRRLSAPPILLSGAGAGGVATSLSVLADLADLARRQAASAPIGGEA